MRRQKQSQQEEEMFYSLFLILSLLLMASFHFLLYFLVVFVLFFHWLILQLIRDPSLTFRANALRSSSKSEMFHTLHDGQFSFLRSKHKTSYSIFRQYTNLSIFRVVFLHCAFTCSLLLNLKHLLYTFSFPMVYIVCGFIALGSIRTNPTNSSLAKSHQILCR